jgi:beta-1,4-mannosyl-glycoprotein beta-1,4-N-acetylglucosaminyltransferase
MIYDCFTYFNEKEILEIRINELAPLKPIHVLIESKFTFTGKDKKLEYSCGDIKYENVIEFCAEVPNNGNPWDNEFAQRNYIKEALKSFNPNDDDIIIISDVDEIPSCEAVKKYSLEMGQTFLMMNHYGGYLNLIYGRNSWPYCKITTWGLLKNTTPNSVRLDGADTAVLQNAGWHFGWMGGIDRAVTKFKSFSHQEPEIQQYSDYENLKQRLEKGQSIFGNEFIEICEIDESYPLYLRENKHKFEKLIKKN